ncbi:hypothetical protein [Spiroplasma platyhelix]|uniref:AAA+ ATPase domain-containing protein n=1 Tax=Spiroplasma platyhelix PALS-1 TaxID=1276218 RepID=A0A846U1M2_9MOLU|nr:hypothetical protein [Spiroplasma platyhelix]NKE38409.1 hypothetical protein [Spiroplasma platyhelix PALS-1]
MDSFKIDENDLIDKISDVSFDRLVIIGKNGVGKTTFTQKITEKLESKGIKSYFIKADLNIDKELKNAKDNNLQKIGLLLNELTNFVYKINEDDLSKYFKENQSFKEFCEKSELNLTKVQEWMDNNFIDKKLQVDETDPDLKWINVNRPKFVNNNIFELNYHKKINMGSIFNSISEDAGTGQYFYTILKLINKILEFCSETKGNYLYLIIDEPENLCHPELIIKIANSLKSIDNKIIKIICISHSAVFVNNFINNLSEIVLMKAFHEFWQYNEKLFLNVSNPIFNKMIEITTKFNFSTENKIKERSVSLNQLMNIYEQGISKWFHHWPIKNEFMNSLFYNKIIICEGLNDEYILNSLFLETNVFILKSFGKFEIPFLLTLLRLFNKKIYTVYDSDISSSKTKKNNEWNSFWNQINSLLSNECLLNDFNSFQFKPNLEYKLNLNKNNKQYMTRMNLFINNSNTDPSNKPVLSNLDSLQKTLKSNIENYFSVKNTLKEKDINEEKEINNYIDSSVNEIN